MEALKQWIVCIIFCSLAGTVVSVLSPKGATERAMKTVVAVFLICAFISPFLGGTEIDTDFNFSNFSFSQNDLSEKITKTMLLEAENQTVIKTEELLESLSVEFKDVKAYAGTDKDNCIYIKLISMSVSDKYRHRERQISSNLKSMFSSEVEFIWVKE